MNNVTQSLWRQRLGEILTNPWIERLVIGVILINAVTLGLETDAGVMARYGETIHRLDLIALSIFVIEIGLRIIAHGSRFFRDPWSLFDFVVVAIALFPASEQFSVLRSLRVLRVLRLLSVVPQMRKVVSALLAAIPGLSSIILVLLLIYYVFAVMATNLFGQAFPEWFGSISASMYTLFQIMTLESWSMGIVRPLMEQFPHAWLFFVPYILIATFTMLNLFIAIIVNAMQSQQLGDIDATKQPVDNDLQRKLNELSTQMAEIKKMLQK